LRRYACYALAILLLILPGLTLYTGCNCNCTCVNQQVEARAAIIDQLDILQANTDYIDNVTLQLEEFGFEVDLYSGKDVTVNLFRELPSHGYKLIIFRVHSGLLGGDPALTNKTWLFTAEEYTPAKYMMEQMTDQITYAKTRDNTPWIFAIGSKFINESMEGEFDNTVLVMMGCDCMHFPDLATAFINKGASAYLGWDASVLLNYVDDTTPVLVEKLLSDELTIERAVTETMAEKGRDPGYNSILLYYPDAAGNRTVRQLIK